MPSEINPLAASLLMGMPIQNEQADNTAAWALYEKAVALGHWDIKPTRKSTSECT